MKKLFLLMVVALLATSVVAQEEPLDKQIDDLTSRWKEEAGKLVVYEGFSAFCQDQDYRREVFDLLIRIHHFDSVLYDDLKRTVSLDGGSREIRKTLAEIERMEQEYSMKTVIHFLHEKCKDRSAIEGQADELRRNVGANSYDGRIYLLENELNSYIRHITKRLAHIRRHVHHLYDN